MILTLNNLAQNARKIIHLGISSLLFLPILFVNSHAQVHDNRALTPDQQQALTLSQEAIGNTTREYSFTDQDRQLIDFSSYRGKPLVVSFIFTSCHHICPMITKNLAMKVDIAREALGAESFQVVTIGFDTAVDTPERMRFFASQRGIDFDGWDFLSADADTIEAITQDMGFTFTPSVSGFDHLAQTTLLDADGKVYRQVYGIDYELPILVEPLKELVFGRQRQISKISEWVNGIRLFCTLYDPSSGRYYFDYSIFIGAAIGILCLGSVLVFIIRAWRENRDSKLGT
jgi:protein SCO1/2